MTTEDTLLLQCLQAAAGTRPSTDIDPLIVSAADWTRFIWRAQQHWVLPLISGVLRSSSVPPDFAAYLEAEAGTDAAVQEVRLAEQKRLAAALHASEIAAIANPAVRLAGDVPPGAWVVWPLGFVVAEQDAGAAAFVLLSQGYTSLFPFTAAREKALRRHRSEYVFYRTRALPSDAGRPAVTLTWRPAPRYYPTRSGFPLPLSAGASQSTFSPEDRFFFLALRGAVDTWPRLDRLVQMARLAGSSNAFDWSAAVARSRETGAEMPLRLGIQLVTTLLGARVPPDVLRFAAEDPRASQLRDRIERRLFSDTLALPDAATKARFHLATLVRWQDRVSYCVRAATTPSAALHGLATIGPRRQELSGAEFTPMPAEILQPVLSFAGITRNDVVYDLGCGDGRVVISAAATYGARGVGIDLDPQCLRAAANAARGRGVQRQVAFRREDALTADLTGATVVVLWVGWSLTWKLQPLLRQRLPSGARVVTVNADMATWPADRTSSIKDEQGDTFTMRLWRMP